MKRIIRLRLINWHYFANINTEIRNITFLTGPNGTGKSTVIDAIQILIEGTTNPSNFNKAANEKGKSGRSLLGYLKGQAGIRDDGSVIAIRNGNFTSYIALEIEDDVEKKIFTVGVLFDVDSKDVSPNITFISIPGSLKTIFRSRSIISIDLCSIGSSLLTSKAITKTVAISSSTLISNITTSPR